MIISADVLVYNDGLGAVVGVDDDLYALVVGIAGTTSEIIARHFLYRNKCLGEQCNPQRHHRRYN